MAREVELRAADGSRVGKATLSEHVNLADDTVGRGASIEPVDGSLRNVVFDDQILFTAIDHIRTSADGDMLVMVDGTVVTTEKS